LACTSSPSMPMFLRFGLLMESLGSCIFLSQLLRCLTKISSVFFLSALDYSSLFMFFSFVVCVGVQWVGAVLDYVPRGWMGKSQVVRDAHLFVLQIHRSSFRTSWWVEMAQCREVSTG
jgi:hypothetical protein